MPRQGAGYCHNGVFQERPTKTGNPGNIFDYVEASYIENEGRTCGPIRLDKLFAIFIGPDDLGYLQTPATAFRVQISASTQIVPR
jgi:hypothetical protein